MTFGAKIGCSFRKISSSSHDASSIRVPCHEIRSCGIVRSWRKTRRRLMMASGGVSRVSSSPKSVTTATSQVAVQQLVATRKRGQHGGSESPAVDLTRRLQLRCVGRQRTARNIAVAAYGVGDHRVLTSVEWSKICEAVQPRNWKARTRQDRSAVLGEIKHRLPHSLCQIPFSFGLTSSC
ncbi:hypothetical protein OROGR_016683 [Orobanche gracilis]